MQKETARVYNAISAGSKWLWRGLNRSKGSLTIVFRQLWMKESSSAPTSLRVNA